ncbi:MAG: DNA translocase FtsK 4TM domain-containing protein, partial [candidate division Zixibacteria bacterium]|nr:DNA translocase FtsK 4TM domain-containing protein [candidate division Zixibacteria bacterium]
MGVTPFFKPGHRQELTGFLLIVLAVIVLISLATYDRRDVALFYEEPTISSLGGTDSLTVPQLSNGQVKALSFNEILHLRAENSAGIVGAVISHLLLWSIGWSAYVLVLVVVVVGWKLLFKYENSHLRNALLRVYAFVFLLGTLIFLFQLDDPLINSTLVESLSGKAGLTVAGLVRTLLAVTGGFALLGAALILVFFTIVPYRPKQARATIDRIIAFFRRSSVGAAAYTRSQYKSWRESLSAVFGKQDIDAEGSESVDNELTRLPATEPEQAKKIEQLPLDLDEAVEGSRKLELKAAKPVRRSREPFGQPPLSLLHEPVHEETSASDSELDEIAKALRDTLNTFGIEIIANSIEKYPGPVITRFEFKPAPGVKINQIVNLADDLALALKASRVRIIAPVPGKSAVGVEIPNRKPQKVFIKEILTSEAYQRSRYKLPLALGKNTAGKPFVVDLARMPHLLIAGSTGSGKSVCLNVLITSLIFRHSPKDLRFIFIDPKILELSVYADIPYLARPVVTKAKMAESVLAGAVNEMEERYRRLAMQSVRSLDDYNAKVPSEDKLPYLLIVVDELADMMMSSSSAKIELLITRLAQMARAVGIHLILATQRPSVDVITGLIKANFSSRIAFQVASKVDSRTILDGNGAEKLLGNGD